MKDAGTTRLYHCRVVMLRIVLHFVDSGSNNVTLSFMGLLVMLNFLKRKFQWVLCVKLQEPPGCIIVTL